jgi:hypothetical protein
MKSFPDVGMRIKNEMIQGGGKRAGRLQRLQRKRRPPS